MCWNGHKGRGRLRGVDAPPARRRGRPEMFGGARDAGGCAPNWPLARTDAALPFREFGTGARGRGRPWIRFRGRVQVLGRRPAVTSGREETAVRSPSTRPVGSARPPHAGLSFFFLLVSRSARPPAATLGCSLAANRPRPARDGHGHQVAYASPCCVAPRAGRPALSGTFWGGVARAAARDAALIFAGRARLLSPLLLRPPEAPVGAARLAASPAHHALGHPRPGLGAMQKKGGDARARRGGSNSSQLLLLLLVPAPRPAFHCPPPPLTSSSLSLSTPPPLPPLPSPPLPRPPASCTSTASSTPPSSTPPTMASSRRPCARTTTPWTCWC